MNYINFSISINQLMAFILSIFIMASSLIFFMFSQFQKTVDELQIAVVALQTQNLMREEECSNLKSTIHKLETQNFTESGNIVLKKSENFNPEILKIFLISLLVLASIFAAYFLFNLVVQKTILGKILVAANTFGCQSFDSFLGSGNIVKTFSVPFENFELKVDLRSDDTCSIMYKRFSSDSFLPFEHFLIEHKELFSKFEIEKLQKSIENGSIESIASNVDIIVTSVNPGVLKGFDAFASIF